MRFLEKTIFVKDVDAQNSWSFEKGVDSWFFVPIIVIIEFQQKDRLNSKEHPCNTFYRPSVILTAQCIVGTEKN